MERIIYSNKNYRICKTGKESLYELARFVVNENHKRHTKENYFSLLEDDTKYVYQEELLYFNSSTIFIVRNEGDKIIGSIRVFKWDREKTLPIQKIFGINPLKAIHFGDGYNFWHIGRFAIDAFSGIPTIVLFKQLMIYAVHPIVCDKKGCMVAEADSKLLRVMNALGIETIQLGHSLNYLASETIPICSIQKGLLPFYKSNRYLYTVS